MSFGAGLLTMLLERRSFLAGGILRESATATAAPNRVEATARSVGAAKTNFLRRIDLGSVAKESAQTLLRFALLMVLAFVLEALTVRYVPADFVAGLLGKGSALAVPLATLVGVPLYTTNLSALGIISGLLRQGMDGGAALAFLIGGAVTTIPAMSAVYGVVKPRVFALYVAFAVAGSLLSGYGFKLAHLFY